MAENGEKQDRRIEAVLGGSAEGMEFTKAVEVFFKHLKDRLKLPCEVTGIEDFNWEEACLFGEASRAEYRKLKQTQPSHSDRFELFKLERGVSSEWMMFPDEDIAAHVRRISDGKKCVLGLSEIEATDRQSPNYQLLDDFSCWFVNAR